MHNKDNMTMRAAAPKVSVLLPPDLKPLNSLKDYETSGGLQGLKKALSLPPKKVVSEVKRSNLRGRGGAGFPTGVKWQSVFEDPSKKKYIVCNGSEGEPGTFKDRYLIRKNPYQLLEGMLIAAHAIGAKEVFIGLKSKFKKEIVRVQTALDEMVKANIVKKNFIKIVLGPDAYLFGEEKALLEVIDGREPMPRIMPPYMQGVKCSPTEHNPTVVNNVETMSNLPQIMAKGADWFLSLGTKDTPGTMIFTLWGDVKRPGMYELSMGTPLRYLLEELGGGPVSARPFKAVFSGVANAAVLPEQFDTPMDFGSMRSIGSGLGSGGFIVYDESICMVKVAEIFSRFLAQESCGQCLPCNMGCRNISSYLARIESGEGLEQDIVRILLECGKVTNQTRCYLPAEESALIASIVNKFRDEFYHHIQKPCRLSRSAVLPKLEDFDETKGVFTLSA